MSGIKLRGTRTVLWLALLSTLLGFALLPPACFATDVEVTTFGPKQYLRTTDKINFYSDSFRGVHGKGKVIIQNGDGNGSNLVSDALVLINGVSVFDPSKINQPGYKLEAPIGMDEKNSILVLLNGEPGSYLTVQTAAEVTPDATSTRVIGIAGGAVSVQNSLGDSLTLEIPPLALDEDTPISISALPNALPGPVAQNIYPGAVLGPSGTFFSLPAKVTITFRRPPENTGQSLLFNLQNSQLAMPIANQTSMTDSIVGEIDHFSPPLVVGLPTEEELGSILSFIAAIPYTDPQNLMYQANALIGLAKKADLLDYVELGDEAWVDVRRIMEDGLTRLYDTPLPSNPCGQYTILMRQLLKAIDILALTQEVHEPLLDRMCRFSLSPQYLFLDVGETWQPGITTALFDPNGKQRSCSVVNWYSANLSVVDIAANGNVCIPTGVRPGITNVSANCDGLLAWTEVSVCSLSGTWQGQYSGLTTGKDGQPKELSGAVTASFTQVGTSVSAVIMGVNVTGTNKNGTVTLGPVQVPCNQGTSTCPAGASGTLSSDCSTLSGSFYVDRPRTITGTFSIHFTAP